MGGLISISVIGILVVLFFSMGVKTATKQIITSSVSSLNEVNPTETRLKMGPQGDMMFAVSFIGMNYTNVTQIFDVELQQENYTTGMVITSYQKVPMVRCTPEHFAFNDEISKIYSGLNLQEAFCPPLNS